MDAPTPTPALRTQFRLVGSRAVKIAVRTAGWYRLTGSELIGMGLGRLDPRLLRLYADGLQVPTLLRGDTTRMTPRTAVEFYGTGLDRPTTDTRLYWLSQGSGPAARVGQDATQPAPAPSVRNFMASVTRRDRSVYFPAPLGGVGGNFFGPLLSSKPVEQTVSIDAADASSPAHPRLEVALQGVSTTSHQLAVAVDGVTVGTMSFAGRDHATCDFQLPAGALRSGEHRVTLDPSGVPGDASLVDYVRLFYPRFFRAHHDELRFELPPGATAQLSGFDTPDVDIFDITDSNRPVRLSAQSGPGGSGLLARAPHVGTARIRVLLAVARDHEFRPASMEIDHPSQWSSAAHGADLVVIAFHTLIPGIRSLVQLRRKQGLRVAVVDVQDVFDEFGYGAHGPAPIRDFLAWAVTHWRRPPHDVLFVGHASFDPRNFEKKGGWDLVPTRLVDATFSQAASDEWLVDFDGSGLPSLAFGRLPARTPAELRRMVAKIVAYRGSGAAESALLVAGSSKPGDSVNFGEVNRELGTAFPPGVSREVIDASGSPPVAAHNRIVQGIDAGPRFVNYVGHGSLNLWADLFDTRDAAGLTNGRRLPLFIMMTCLNGYFIDPSIDSLSEALLVAPHGGAVAVWSSTGETVPGSQIALNRAFYRVVFSHPGIRLGDAILLAAPAASDPDVRDTWVLLGDPTMRLG